MCTYHVVRDGLCTYCVVTLIVLSCTLICSVQFKIVSICSEKLICPPPHPPTPISQNFPWPCLWNSVIVHLIDDGLLRSFQGRSSSASSFNASLLQVIDGVMSLALCLLVVSWASKNISDLLRSKLLERVALPAFLSAQSFPLMPACPEQYSHRSFQRWMSTIDSFQSGLPTPLFTFCSMLVESVRMLTCVVWFTSWGNPVEDVRAFTSIETVQGVLSYTVCTYLLCGDSEFVLQVVHFPPLLWPCRRVSNDGISHKCTCVQQQIMGFPTHNSCHAQIRKLLPKFTK